MLSKRGRLDQFIAKSLQVSKKAVRQLVLDKKVLVDGIAALSVDMQINEFHHIVCNGNTLQQHTPCYYLLNKPKGVVSATIDEIHPTAVDLLINVDKHMLHIAGRLDVNSTGLLLITNDARWSQALMSPDNKVEKHYLVTLENPIDESYIEAFANGMYFEFENSTTLPAKLEIIGTHQAIVSLKEGKYHQIKRMFGRFRNPVIDLHRYAIGDIRLPVDLQQGEFRALTADEVNSVWGKR